MARTVGGGSRRAGHHFRTTQWSVVLAAADPANPEAREALATLCETYWFSVYVYLRRRGANPDEARDLTQGFFARFIEKNYAADARRERGKFRTFLLTAVKHYLANEHHRRRARKRGGARPPLSIDLALAEKAYHLEPAHVDTPERIYDRRWARTLVERSMGELRREVKGSPSGDRFEKLQHFLTGGASERYREVGRQLNMSEAAVKVAVHRLRKRFGALLREEVARTVAVTSDVDDELRHLLTILGE